MAGDMCDSYRFDDAIYRSRIRRPDARGRRHYADAGVTGDNACTATGRFPVLGLLHDGAVYRGDDFDDTQICRKLAPVGDNQRNQCGDFALQGVYAMSLEYLILTFIAVNGSRLWINSARERGSRALSR